MVQIPFRDSVIALSDWPALKPSMPRGGGAEFPGRPLGNRALPVLKLPDGQMMPESASIAQYIERLAPALLNPACTSDAQELFRMSQQLPLFWPTALLARFPQRVADCILRGDTVTLADAKFSDADSTLIRSWLDGQPNWQQCIETLHSLEHRLGAGPFFGGAAPHYGDFAVWVQVDAYQTLLGKDAFGRFGEVWCQWYGKVAALEGINQYLSSRPAAGNPGTGYAGSIIMEHAIPSERPTARF